MMTFLFEVWRSDYGVIGQQIEEPYRDWLGKYAHKQGKVWLFSGHTAICEVLTVDKTITRAEAIQFCNYAMKGGFMVLSFDLARCTVTKTYVETSYPR